jgi:hypothetical protein
VDNHPPVVEYESPRSTLEQLDGAVLYRLKRPASLPQIVFISFVMVFFGGVIWIVFMLLPEPASAHAYNYEQPSRVITGGIVIAICVVYLCRLGRELRGVQRAGCRPFVVAVHQNQLYVDDPCKPRSLLVIHPRAIIAIEVQHKWFSGDAVWSLKFVLDRARQVKLEFIEPDRDVAINIQRDLCALLGLSAT